MEGAIRGSWKKGLVSRLIQGLDQNSFQTHPYFPDLLRQPDLLTVPAPGKLIAVFAYRYHISWHTVLASLEDLFETKIHVGEHTVVAAFLLPQPRQTAHADALQLLQNTFDSFQTFDQGADASAGALRAVVNRATPKAALNDFLRYEREQIQVSLRRFSEIRYRPLVEQFRQSESPGRDLKDHVDHRLRALLGNREIVKQPLMHNVKGYLGELPRRYSFEFDFGVSSHPDIAIEVMRSGRYGSREKIRYLMTKARLLRYEIVDDRLLPRPRAFRPLLIVDGNIAGPDHDPYRYVRALISVGWELLRIDELEELPRLVSHADLQS